MSIGFELPLGGFLKSHRSFSSHIPLFILFPAHPSHYLGLGIGFIIKGLYLTLWEELAKSLGVKVADNKSLRIKPQDASPRDPQESNKRLLSKKQRDP